jgi:diadenosine tetraphosphatase ApaH/serine/threonine PP2A family protein phosphatase
VRYLILSDLHGNLQAQEAVVADAARAGYDAMLCLGDLVGYGGQPSVVMAETLGMRPAAIVRGNHDKVCAGLEPDTYFSDVARASVAWTRQRLTPAEIQTLANLPRGPLVVGDGFEICHGTPFDEDHYLFDEQDARRAVRAMSTALCLFGHTHVPGIFSTATDLGGQQLPDVEGRRVLPRTGRTLVNVGSVGQPRDGDPRAAYGLYDRERHAIEIRRVPYDIKAAQQAIVSAGLPLWLALRLERGQ